MRTWKHRNIWTYLFLPTINTYFSRKYCSDVVMMMELTGEVLLSGKSTFVQNFGLFVCAKKRKLLKKNKHFPFRRKILNLVRSGIIKDIDFIDLKTYPLNSITKIKSWLLRKPASFDWALSTLIYDALQLSAIGLDRQSLPSNGTFHCQIQGWKISQNLI